MQEALGAVLTVCLAVSQGIHLDDHERSVMVTEARTVWQRHGVAIQQGEANNCDRLLLVKSDAEARPEDIANDSAIGWVTFVAGIPRPIVFLRLSRAHSLIRDMSTRTRPKTLTRLLAAGLLGRVLAHEIGHVLLNSVQHRPKGLMRAQYHAREMLIPISTYTLDADERALFFAATGKEVRFAHR